MAVLIQGKLLYLATQHTASKATEEVLVRHGGKTIAPSHATLAEIMAGKTWIERRGSPGKHGDPARMLTPTTLKYTTRRSLYELVVTWYVRRRPMDGNMPFHIFCENHGRAGKPSQYLDADGRVKHHCRDVAGQFRMETLQGDIVGALKLARIPLKDTELPLKNRTKGKHPWLAYYNDTAFRIVNERWGEEFTSKDGLSFGYPMFNSWAEASDHETG